jgi:N-acetylmuramoyl-L-alanine amidase
MELKIMQHVLFSPYSVMIKKVLTVAIFAVVLSGCTTRPAETETRDGYFASHVFKANGQNERVRFLVMHYTALDDNKSLKTLTEDPVSAHYLVPKKMESKQGKPVVLQLVDENKRAWHAGVSSWNGRANLNDTSIGIEIVNPGYTDNMLGQRTWYPYSEKQIAAITVLAKDIIHRYQIAPDNVLEHSDIAPLRKQDPGKLFPWEHLAGRSPHAPAEVGAIQALLKQYGYDQIPQNDILDENTRKTLSAFQMHFRPADISGNADAETEAIARALIEKYRSTPAQT